MNCTASDTPKPKEVLAVAPDSVTNVEPLPTMMLESEGVSPDNAASSESNACTSTPISKPKAVLAPEAVIAPVPPSDIPIKSAD